MVCLKCAKGSALRSDGDVQTVNVDWQRNLVHPGAGKIRSSTLFLFWGKELVAERDHKDPIQGPDRDSSKARCKVLSRTRLDVKPLSTKTTPATEPEPRPGKTNFIALPRH